MGCTQVCLQLIKPETGVLAFIHQKLLEHTNDHETAFIAMETLSNLFGDAE